MSIKIHDKQDKTYIILGTPHTATSFVAKMLEEAGVEMNSTKKNGVCHYYEDGDFVELNKKILEDAKGSVNRPPTEKRILQTGYNKDIKELINKKKSKFWGFKDPRTSLTIKKYLPYLDDDVYLICCFRKPKNLKKSLKHPEMIDRYNRSIISAIKEFCEL